MTTANARKGAETERMVVKYLQENGFPLADRRLREGRSDDQGDIDGVPFSTIQVKYEKANRYQAWVTATLRQREAAGNPLCLLVRRVKYKPVGKWEALMPSSYFIASFEDLDGVAYGDYFQESEAWTWMRMDLDLAVFALKRMVTALRGLSHPSSIITWPGTEGRPVTVEWSFARSTESGSPPSPTT